MKIYTLIFKIVISFNAHSTNMHQTLYGEHKETQATTFAFLILPVTKIRNINMESEMNQVMWLESNEKGSNYQRREKFISP